MFRITLTSSLMMLSAVKSPYLGMNHWKMSKLVRNLFLDISGHVSVFFEGLFCVRQLFIWDLGSGRYIIVGVCSGVAVKRLHFT